MANLTEREKRDKFREEAIDNHIKLFGTLFCRLCGYSRRYMHAHHTIVPYKDDDTIRLLISRQRIKNNYRITWKYN